MGKMVQDSVGEDAQVGAFEGGPVELRRTADGRSLLLPASPGGRRLNNDAAETLADVQGVVAEIGVLRDRLDGLVDLARECGAPWSLIGFSLGMTGEAARKRWSE